jgi:hypothetical protein
MVVSPCQPWRNQRWLLMALALAFQGHVVSASSVSSPPFDARAHAAICKCGPRCRQSSCCCGRPSPARHRDRLASPISTSPAGSTTASPCIEEAPCGEPGLPHSTAPRLHDRAGALVRSISLASLLISGFLALPTACGRPRWCPRRIQRPPRPVEPV